MGKHSSFFFFISWGDSVRLCVVSDYSCPVIISKPGQLLYFLNIMSLPGLSERNLQSSIIEFYTQVHSKFCST